MLDNHSKLCYYEFGMIDIIETEIAQPRVTDEQARRIIEMHTKCQNASDFQRLDVATRNQYLKLLKAHGLSIRQISRLTGISFGVVRRI